mmetsp:Transcript_36929/g.61205  ORF Transcript_36929/g.61205 Transcript_36929/m.61205 type:complete len:276 (-) Transcript_36929:122-949(-)|eukprot:CAMPEP_0119312536 /NCGR_PEP_ID=MMETSP1333-20130426/26837_1 /TAXON_ID=418940 /ORGANISM="Scyphosphaera apsteinii, Strain RCC1455" /LENGTH=275 /DNA_ID=CAMNT_0007317177 /DNA_START=40 /DNA_END=867 /DNA_ORIENTATION=+
MAQSCLDNRLDIPNVVHQPWLHGTRLRWEHVLGMIATHFIVRPSSYWLYYDKQPPLSLEWRCACDAFATKCVQQTGSHVVPGTRNRRLRMMHWPDIMRLELLIKHGGIFLDHDVYALHPLDELRRCPAAPVVAGLEEGLPRKLNPGVLLAMRQAHFLHIARASWQNYSTTWDYNCCEATYVLAEQHPTLVQLRSDLGPLPRYKTQAEYNRFLKRALVVHTTALSHAWRREELKQFGVMRYVLNLVIRAANQSAKRHTQLQTKCILRAREEIEKSY